MSKRIGELLIGKGLLNAKQLDAALRAQLIVGGHLGTSLIELGFVHERDFGVALAELFNTRYAPPELLIGISPLVVDVVSRDLVERHKAIPLKKLDGTLELAMVNPADFIAVQEFGFATGCRIEPWVSPEVRIYEAMERYYGIDRPRRYVMLSRALAEASAAHSAQHGAATRPGSRPAHAGTGPVPTGTGSEPGLARPTLQAASPTPDAAAFSSSLSRGLPAVATAVLEATAVEIETDAEMPGVESQSGVQLHELANFLCRAETDQEIADAVCAFVTRGGERCLFFHVRDGEAIFWCGAGAGINLDVLDSRRFALSEHTLFHLLLEEPYYCGPVPEDEDSARLFEALGLEPPPEIALLPVFRAGQLRTLMYVDCGAGTSMMYGIDDYRRLARMTLLGRMLVEVKRQVRAV